MSSASSGFAPIIDYNLAPPASTDLPTRPSTPPMPTKPPADLMSPIPGFEPKDYNHNGLYTFMRWLQEKYGDDDFEDAFTKLLASRIGLDLLPNITEAILIDRLHITLGTALRIIKDLKNGKHRLKYVHYLLKNYPAMTKLTPCNRWSNSLVHCIFHFFCEFFNVFISLQLMASSQCTFNDREREYDWIVVGRIRRTEFELAPTHFDGFTDFLV